MRIVTSTMIAVLSLNDRLANKVLVWVSQEFCSPVMLVVSCVSANDFSYRDTP